MVTSNDIRALTVQQPFAYAISDLDKRTENRRWSAPWDGTLFIHAAATIRASLVRELRRSGEIQGNLSTSAIVAVAKLDDVHASSQCSGCDDWAEYDTNIFHWRLTAVRRLDTPVPCKGALRLWRPSSEVITAVAAQLEP